MIKPYSPNLTQRVQTYSGIAAEAIPLRNIDIVIYSAFSTLDHSLDRGLQIVVEGYKGLTQSIKDYICYSKRGRMREKQQRAKELEQKRQKREERMKNLSGGSKYAQKSEDGNQAFWKNNPNNKKPKKEKTPNPHDSDRYDIDDLYDRYRRLRRFKERGL